MPELIEIRLNKVNERYRWTALFTVPGSRGVHRIAVAHGDSEMAALQMGRMVDSVLCLFSKEYGRG